MVGRETTIEVQNFSWLLLRINDEIGSRSDNSGMFQVQIDPIRN